MYALGCRTCQQNPGLGLDVGSAFDAGKQILGGIFGLFGGPSKCESEGVQRVDAAFAGAMRGDAVARQCLEDMAKGIYKHGEEGTTFNPPRSCALGCQRAVDYAKARWVELRAREAAGPVGMTLIGQSTIPTTVAGTARNLTPVLVGVAALVLLPRLLGRR